MAWKMIATTWKKRLPLTHNQLWQRMTARERTEHMWHCQRCLDDAIELVKKFKTWGKEIQVHGTISGRMYPSNPDSTRPAGRDAGVGTEADSSA